jgi:uncharacterized protein (TIGR00369 family)
LKFTYDEEGKCFVSKFRLARRFTGPPGHAHGGIIATILDEIMGKPSKLREVTVMTREMTVEYLKPVPLGKPLVAVASESHVRGRVHVNLGEIRNQAGDVLARSRGTFIAIDPHKVLGKHVNSSTRNLEFLRPHQAERQEPTDGNRRQTAKGSSAKC